MINKNNYNSASNIWNLALAQDIEEEMKMFLIQFNEIPNWFKFKSNFNINSLYQELNLNFNNKIIWKKFLLNETTINKETNKKAYYMGIIDDGILICFESKCASVLYSNTISIRVIASIKSIFKKFKVQENPEKKKFNIIKNTGLGYDVAKFEIRKMEFDLKTNYNDDLSEIHPKIINFLNSKNTGLLLFHGLPGTGKTSYLRYLVSICNSRFIYVPNNFFNELTNPSFIDFISDCTNSVIILEDCEDLLKPRTENSYDSGISTLLNLGDGLLGDALQLKIICTFNTDLKNIDQALLRKGRLVHIYDFKKLTIEKSNNFLSAKNNNNRVLEPTSISDLYSFCEDNGTSDLKKPDKKIGFV